MKPKLVIDTFTIAENPVWTCPSCNSNTLSIKKDCFHFEHDAASTHIERSDDSCTPLELGGVFSAILNCLNPKCGEVVSCNGSGFWDIEYDTHDNLESYYSYFEPKFFNPTLRPIQISNTWPLKVKEALLASFSLVCVNASSASNLLRVAVESMLDDQNIPIEKEIFSNRKRKKVRADLAWRLTQLGKQRTRQMQDLLDALRHMGNSGSHKFGSVDPLDVLQGYEVFEYVLIEIYPVPNPSNVVMTASQLTSKYKN